MTIVTPLASTRAPEYCAQKICSLNMNIPLASEMLQ